jgi:hypothetical protein
MISLSSPHTTGGTMRTYRRWILAGIALVVLGGLFSDTFAQPALPAPEASPAASVSQRVGITDISISYHRPGVKGRTIWGTLVPYNEVWRAGANENTTITFSDPVTIQGKPLAAGTYGLHMIPSKSDWTIIVSKNSTSWGSFSYQENEDALRVKSEPKPAPSQEWLSYQVDLVAPNAVSVSLRWEKLEIPFKVEVDMPATVLRKIREEYLRGLARFGWQGWYQSAAFCATNRVNLDEANTWIDRSIRMNRNFNNLWVKSDLQELAGKGSDAKATRAEALKLANEAAINTLGYQYLGNGRTDAAIELFKINVEKYPDSWNVYDSLGEGYATMGEKKLAIEYYSKALAKTTDEAQKTRIRQTLDALGTK